MCTSFLSTIEKCTEVKIKLFNKFTGESKQYFEYVTHNSKGKI